jgi:hypothetical protein
MQTYDRMTTTFPRPQIDDPHLHLYQVSGSPYASPLAEEPRTFGEKDARIDIVDSFQGRRPFLINRDFLASSGDYQLEILVTLILDSNMASRLHEYRTGRDLGFPNRRAATEDFLAFVSRLRIDYNPVFYMTESAGRSERQNFIDCVAPVLTSILYLHSMDEDRFVETRQIMLKPEAVDHYLAKYGARTLEECGHVWVRNLLPNQNRPRLDQFAPVRASYVCLLKLTLIHKRSRRSVVEKMEEFESFLLRELQCNMGRESHLALYYFADLVQRLLPVQRTSNFVSAKARLLGTAWDMWLLRLPEMLLNPREHPVMNLAYVCSAEKELTALGRFFSIECMGRRSDDNSILGPVLSLDATALESKLGRDAVRALISRKAPPRHKHSDASTAAPADHVEVLALKLESELMDFLQG